jgi:hypothetical protein
MGGIMQAAGIPGFLGNLGRLQEEVAIGEGERADFLAQLYERDQGPRTVDGWLEVILAVNQGTSQQVSVPDEMLEKWSRDPKQALSYYFRANRGAIQNGHRLVRLPRGQEGRRHTEWRIERV